MSNFRDEMPVSIRHEGEWAGTYTVIDNDGKIIDKYKSHITCQFPENTPQTSLQINRYEWSDGRSEEYEFTGTCRDKKSWFETERVSGYSWEVDDSIIMVKFTYKDNPDAYVYEMIHISPCNNHRTRTWHWFKNNQIYQRTLIKEERVR